MSDRSNACKLLKLEDCAGGPHGQCDTQMIAQMTAIVTIAAMYVIFVIAAIEMN